LAVKIRLRRMGAKGRPFYRLVVADSRSPRDGRFIELIGYYDPMTEPVTVKIDTQKALHWLSRGAQPTDTARALLKKESSLDEFISAREAKGKEKVAPAEPVTTEQEAEAEPTPAKKKTRAAASKPAAARKTRKAAKAEEETAPAEPVTTEQEAEAEAAPAKKKTRATASKSAAARKTRKTAKAKEETAPAEPAAVETAPEVAAGSDADAKEQPASEVPPGAGEEQG